MKIKQDLLHRRQAEEKDKSEERDLVGAVGLLGPPPPLPPGIPGKAPTRNGGIYQQSKVHQAEHEQPLLDDFTSSILRHAHPSFPTSSLLAQKESPRRPSSVLGASSISSTSRHTDLDQEGSGSSNGGESQSNRDGNSEESLSMKHRRVASISEVDHIPVHTPV